MKSKFYCPDSITNNHVMLVFSIKTTESTFSRVCHSEETFRESLDPVAVVDLSKMLPYHLPQGEGIKKLVPQKNIFGTQLRNITIGFQQEVFFSLKSLCNFNQLLHSFSTVHKSNTRSLQVWNETWQMLQWKLQTFQWLQQQSAHLLVDSAGDCWNGYY